MAAKAEAEKARADKVSGQLQDANAIVSADKEKVDLQLRELESLRRDIAALQTVRTQLEARVSALAAAEQQAKLEAGALRDRAKELEAKLAASDKEKTVLAQKAIANPDVQLRALTERAEAAERELAAEQEVARANRAQVEALTVQVAALREQ